MIHIELPKDVKFIISTLEEHGQAAYAVGGCVRDFCLGRKPDDWDITTSARPDEIKALFPRTIDTGIQHGTVTVMMGRIGYEVTTYRIDGDYSDGRHPDSVTFTDVLTEDLKRRDFTINAMAYNDTMGLVDEFGGMEDLKAGVIRCVGNAEERFSEDALRMLRAVRFAAQLGFEIEEDTYAAITKLAPTLERVSAERIRVELMKLLASDNPWRIRTACETGLTRVFFPEFDEMMLTPQNTPHHCYSVGEHTIATLMNIRADKNLRLAMLVHDIGKPSCRWRDENGRDHFTGHPEAGVPIAREVLRRLKFDNDTIDFALKVVRYHDERPEATERNVRRLMARAGKDIFPELFEVKRADTLGQSLYLREEKLKYIDDIEKCYMDIIEQEQAVTIKDLAINGRDIMELGIPSGPYIGEILSALLEEVLDDPDKNDRKTLILLVKSRFLLDK